MFTGNSCVFPHYINVLLEIKRKKRQLFLIHKILLFGMENIFAGKVQHSFLFHCIILSPVLLIETRAHKMKKQYTDEFRQRQKKIVNSIVCSFNLHHCSVGEHNFSERNYLQSKQKNKPQTESENYFLRKHF